MPCVRVEPLEPRQLLAAAAPTNVEQYLIELVNRARADPAAEAARFGIDLNEGLPAGTISSAPKQPLAVSPFLTDSARGHSQWMVDNNVFSHTGAGGSSPMQRTEAAGYVFNAPWAEGENIAWRGTKPGVPDPVATAAREHQDLFVDDNYPGRGHRLNILSPDFREIGAGVATGVFTGYNAVMVTEDFAASGAGSFLTGVAYADTIVADDFYTPGEGIGGAAITARRTSDNATFVTNTYPSGGYSLKLPPGTYDVITSGIGSGTVVHPSDVTIGTENVKRDYRPRPVGRPTITGRKVFYNNSIYDGHNNAANFADLDAVAPDKTALLPGQAASFANVTSYAKGINGVLIDFSSVLPGGPSAEDFTFRVGQGTNPTAWTTAPAPTGIVMFYDPVDTATAHVAITWPDGAIMNRWLQVTVKANGDTGLAAPDVFYFGNLVGETGDSTTSLRVSSLDLAATRARLSTTSRLTGYWDFDRDGKVSALDLASVRRNLFESLDFLTISA